MAENFLELIKDMDLWLLEAQPTLPKINFKSPHLNASWYDYRPQGKEKTLIANQECPLDQQ